VGWVRNPKRAQLGHRWRVSQSGPRIAQSRPGRSTVAHL
jgi:hypothetical protein